jgi:RNA recognition motif-containing protein
LKYFQKMKFSLVLSKYFIYFTMSFLPCLGGFLPAITPEEWCIKETNDGQIVLEEFKLNIYVGNLPRASSEDAVRKAFEAHGQVADVKLIKDNFTGELRGFGFVEMPNKAEAIAAMQALNGADFEGRKLVVNEARPKTDRRGGGGGGNFGGGRPRSW